MTDIFGCPSGHSAYAGKEGEMTFPHKILHLTVTGEGEVECWDNRDRALLGKGKHDVYVQLVLTLKQTEQIKEAVKSARDGHKKR